MQVEKHKFNHDCVVVVSTTGSQLLSICETYSN